MSFGFDNINSINKAQAAYKDGGGLGGGGMYMGGNRKRKDEEDEDMFERQEEKDDNEITMDSDLKESDIPRDSIINKFVNWFRIGKK